VIIEIPGYPFCKGWIFASHVFKVLWPNFIVNLDEQWDWAAETAREGFVCWNGICSKGKRRHFQNILRYDLSRQTEELINFFIIGLDKKKRKSILLAIKEQGEANTKETKSQEVDAKPEKGAKVSNVEVIDDKPEKNIKVSNVEDINAKQEKGVEKSNVEVIDLIEEKKNTSPQNEETAAAKTAKLNLQDEVANPQCKPLEFKPSEVETVCKLVPIERSPGSKPMVVNVISPVVNKE